MVLRVLRALHVHPSPYKVFCIKAGLEALFPTANRFVYDWEDLPDRLKNWRFKRDADHLSYLSILKSRLARSYPQAEFIVPSASEICKATWNFIPTPNVKRGLRADIVIAPRLREHAPERNFTHWQTLIDGFRAMGLTVAAIGSIDTSVRNLNGLAYYSWEFDLIDAAIELLQNCKLALMTESGGAHLAVLCGAPLKVIYDMPGRQIARRSAWYVEEMQMLATAHCEPISRGWNYPATVLSSVERFLKQP